MTSARSYTTERFYALVALGDPTSLSRRQQRGKNSKDWALRLYIIHRNSLVLNQRSKDYAPRIEKNCGSELNSNDKDQR